MVNFKMLLLPGNRSVEDQLTLYTLHIIALRWNGRIEEPMHLEEGAALHIRRDSGRYWVIHPALVADINLGLTGFNLSF